MPSRRPATSRPISAVRPAQLVLAVGGALLGAIGLGACSRGLERIDADQARQLERGEEIARRLEPTSVAASAPEPAIDVDALRTADDYVQLALRRNPAIRAAEARVSRLRERVPQVQSLEDPVLMVAPVGEMAETAAGQVGTMTSLSQKLPLGDKLQTRGRIAGREASQAEADLARARVELAGQVRRAYWAYALAEATIATTNESRGLLVQFRDVADALYRSGTRDQQDVLRVSAEIGSVDTELARLDQQRESAGAMLRRLIAAPRGLALPSPALPSESPGAGEAADRSADELLERASRINPSLRAGAERLGEFEARERLAQLERWPDLTLSVSYNFVSNDGLAPSRTGDDQWWVGLGINLPIWRDRLEAAEREALAGRLEAASSLAAARDTVAFNVEDAALRLESQRRVLTLIRDQVIPDARAAVEASANAYRSGTGDSLGLLDNWRKLLAQRVLEQQVSAGIQQALADLSEAVGEESAPDLSDGAEGEKP